MQLPGLSIGIVADDLTGANDTALPFFLSGCATQVLLGLENPAPSPGTQVWAINTESRHMDPREATAVVRRSVAMLRDRYGVENVYKKIDSTLRGNIAHECLAVLDEMKWDCAVIAPAFPEQGRRTVGGYHIVRGTPVEQTEVARDPLCPVRQSHIPTLLKQTTKPEIVGHIELSTVLHGAGPVLKALSDQIKAGKKLVVVDACSNVDLEQIALAIEKIRKTAQVLPCGSAGLAQALTKLWPCDLEAPQREDLLPPSPILIVVGSNSATTRTQIVQLIENYAYYGEGSQLQIFDLSPEKILGFAPLEHEVAQIVEALGERNTVVLSTSIKEENLALTQELARNHQMDPEKAPLMAQSALAKIVRGVLSEKSAKLVLSGGETATHICKAIGSQTLRISAEAEPSIPLTQDPHAVDDPRWIVTKSGNFGTPLAFANIVKFLKQREASSVNV